jgi:uncharacterized C2H2 Zn-finger protein
VKCPHCGKLFAVGTHTRRHVNNARLFECFDRNFEEMLGRCKGKQDVGVIFAVMRATSAAIGRDTDEDLKDWLCWREERQPGFLQSIEERF